MRTWTYAELKTKVQNDLDLADEEFVTSQEYLDLFNEALDEAESEIIDIHEDYFYTDEPASPITLVAGTSDYSLPANIYANKIRGLVYSNGSNIYEILPYRRRSKLLSIIEDKADTNSGDRYRYYLKTNSASAGWKLCLVPTPQEAGTYIKIGYIRNADRFTAGGSEPLDIPEFANFVLEYVKAKIRQKENGGTMPPDAAALVQQQREQMTSTLTRMTDDDHDTVEADYSHYEDHS